MVPKPFTRVTLRFGEMIKLDPAETEEDFERQRLRIENTMLSWLKR
jgi:lysophospholipid acyltransferase (LPLAT)-like uncharacterized protein